jgi:DNA-binding transcriptional regulator YdaS (Cro superfamily)
MKSIDRAIKLAGGLTELARRISEQTGKPISIQAIRKWRENVPAERCPEIERAVDGAVTRADLRPDLWGDTPKPAKRAA